MLLDLVQLRLRQHPAIPHYHYSSQAELLPHLVHLVRDRCGISGIARIDLYCYWSPLRIGQHSVDDDRQPLLSISVVTQACQRAGATLVVAARDVVQNRAPLGKMALGQLVFDALFTFQQPVHGLVEVILVGVLHRQLLRKCGRMPLSRRGQLRAWMDQPLRDHPHHQVALAAMLRRNDGVQPKLANRAQDGFDVPVWKCSLGAEEIVRRNQRLIPKKPPQGFNLVLGPVGEVGQRALAGFLAFPPSFAQQDGRWRIAVGDDFDIHGSYYSYRYLYVKHLIHIYMGTY